MKFPGERYRLHYFPRGEKSMRRLSTAGPLTKKDRYIVGVSQPILDIGIDLGSNTELLEEFNIPIGESVVLSREDYARLDRTVKEKYDCTIFAGGAVANILHNYSVLSGERSYLLGTIPSTISFCDNSYHYLSKTNPLVYTNKLSPLKREDASVATALTFLTTVNGISERTFALSMGTTNELEIDAIRRETPLIKEAAATVLTAYLIRDHTTAMYEASIEMLRISKQHAIPVVLGMGTSSLVTEMRDELVDLLRKYVTVAAMNVDEARALTLKEAAMEACNVALDYVDICIITEGVKGITIGGYCDRKHIRRTDNKIHSKNGIESYNEFEYSRLFLKEKCNDPVRVFSHVHPFRGGPTVINSTNGAGDSVVAAVLHDIAANMYHSDLNPESDKHQIEAFTFSSASRIAQYGNRVAYQILKNGVSRLLGEDLRDEEER